MRRRWITWTVVVLGGLLLLFYVGGGWYFANQIKRDALDPKAPGEPRYETEVVGLDAATVTLDLESGNEHLEGLGLRGISWEGGHGQLGDIVATTETSVTRRFTLVSGTLAVGTMVDLDGFVYEGDPQTAHGIDFQTVTYSSALGTMDAWYVPADGDGWVVLVHGKGAPKREFLRVIPALHEAGIHSLVISYRNDVGAPPDPTDAYRYGLSEWEDLAAAVAYAADQGAGSIGVFGASMGGGIVTSFLLESDMADTVDAAVLDAPMLDFSVTVDHQAAAEELPLVGLGVPQSLTNVAKLLADWRFDIGWGAMDYVDRADELVAPMLIFHGTDDPDVPLGPSRELAELRPDLVELVEVDGAGHVLSWNVDPAGYDASLLHFLARTFQG
jgi:alpha-beta hydrolase superfamily lysophospholipase